MKREKDMPSWVYWGLYTVNSREEAIRYFLIILLFTIFLVVLALYRDAMTFSVFFMPLVPLWYKLAINWADKHKIWKEDK